MGEESGTQTKDVIVAPSAARQACRSFHPRNHFLGTESEGICSKHNKNHKAGEAKYSTFPEMFKGLAKSK